MEFLSDPHLLSQASALGKVLMIDLVLAGDNAVAVGLAAAALPQEQRRKAILIGLAAAVVMRIGLALITVQLLAIVGLLLAGGFLLLWVCWKMWRELREQATHDQAEAEAEIERAMAIEHGGGPSPEELGLKRKTFGAALIQIMIADLTMSLDNVLAVAGASHDHPWIMVFGLILSIALMGLAASFIAKLLNRYRWIAYIGLVIVLYVALHMIWDGGRSVIVRTGHADQFNASAPAFLDIGAEEQAKHMKHASAGSKHATPAALPGGREQQTPPPEPAVTPSTN
ncbi:MULTISPECIES: TerC family protein [unclassified Brevundimonas]|uniref:TerC family protein n=1 Tax=unclassified Brevundimonas TaxID=2622653 RepID=UPI000CFC968F|nr:MULTISPECIES: TerC family protein [unclassified Brevundimonas]PRA23054.1 tellurium resistance protein TerC [Brevundimonas sp. MYb27]PQZ81644.1 tellurium resistance protein TerC [Brevundimonas sp. MYb31]PRB10453.1 tellurium resistance protein TerC [Brevundimonas sp. MYb52]PRB32866.1 tellurium resistance protein TerC [Brevundimonas sp. MYb46]PRB47309.1 tellurium resistance protein TerC [Brevundimonas sp. MYb33]